MKLCARILSTVLLGAFLYMAPRNARADSPPLDFVFDLDETLITSGDSYPGELIKTFHDRKARAYRVRAGARELLLSLSRIPGARISVYSRKSRAGVQEVLKGFKLDGHRTLADLVGPRAYGFEDNVITVPKDIPINLPGVTPEMKRAVDHEIPLPQFDSRLKKDLTLIPDLDLSRAFLIDDKGESVMGAQLKNWIKVRHSYRKTGIDPVSFENDLVRVRGLIEEALQEARKKGISPVEALWQLQWNEKNRPVTPLTAEHHQKWISEYWNAVRRGDPMPGKRTIKGPGKPLKMNASSGYGLWLERTEKWKTLTSQPVTPAEKAAHWGEDLANYSDPVDSLSQIRKGARLFKRENPHYHYAGRRYLKTGSHLKNCGLRESLRPVTPR